jgi:hypothetical protein
MPYISQEDRNTIDRYLTRLFEEQLDTFSSGQITYILTCICRNWLASRKQAKGELRFDDYSDVLKVLESAKLEYYRRVMVPFEEGKKIVNGDVY